METTKTLKTSAWRRAVLLAGIGVVSAGSVAGALVRSELELVPLGTLDSRRLHLGRSAPRQLRIKPAWANVRDARIRSRPPPRSLWPDRASDQEWIRHSRLQPWGSDSDLGSSITVLRADGQHVTDAIELEDPHAQDVARRPTEAGRRGLRERQRSLHRESVHTVLAKKAGIPQRARPPASTWSDSSGPLPESVPGYR